MNLKMLLLLPYRTVVHDFFLGIPVFCLLRVSVYTHQGQWWPPQFFMWTFWTDKGIHFVYFLYQSHPTLSWSFVRCRFCITLGRLFMFYILSSFRLVTELWKTSIFVCFPFCSAGIQAVVTDQVFVLRSSLNNDNVKISKISLI